VASAFVRPAAKAVDAMSARVDHGETIDMAAKVNISIVE